MSMDVSGTLAPIIRSLLHMVPEAVNAVKSRRLLMMDTRVPETCRAI
jgi:hypothetical protein